MQPVAKVAESWPSKLFPLMFMGRSPTESSPEVARRVILDVQFRMRPITAVVVLLTAVFLSFQFYGLTTGAASRDEAFSWRLIQYPPREQIERTGRDVHPPLYYLLLTGWAALAGNSLAALRSFSVATVFAAIAVTAIATRATFEFVAPGISREVKRNCALFTFAFLAIHTIELDAGRNARMYALGMLLAGLSAWLLLKAMFRPAAQFRWWVAYGVWIAAFAYTHYYAFFTIFAQLIYAAATILGRVKQNNDRWRRDAAGILLAVVVAGIIYLPWVSTLIRQTGEVREGYWIPTPKWSDVAQAQFFWGTGYKSSSAWDWWAYAIGCIVLLAVPLVRLFPAASFWSLQAAVPWFCAICISWADGTSVFRTHYFSIAHVALGALAGVIVASMPNRPLRIAAAWLILAACLMGTWKHVVARFRDEPAIAMALEFIKDRHETGDIILAPWYGEVNRLRYYARQASVADSYVHVLEFEPAAAGHTVHIASLTDDDSLERDTLICTSDLRVWGVEMEGGLALAEFAPPVFSRRFSREGDGHDCTVSLYVKRDGKWISSSTKRELGE